jgi:hypothetical protein
LNCPGKICLQPQSKVEGILLVSSRGMDLTAACGSAQERDSVASHPDDLLPRQLIKLPDLSIRCRGCAEQAERHFGN